MFKHIFLVFLLIPVTSNATNWTPVDPNDLSHLIDKDSIKKKDGLVFYKTKVNALSEYYSIYYFQQDCKNGSERLYKEERYANIGDKLYSTTTYHKKNFNENPTSLRNKIVCR